MDVHSPLFLLLLILSSPQVSRRVSFQLFLYRIYIFRRFVYFRGEWRQEGSCARVSVASGMGLGLYLQKTVKYHEEKAEEAVRARVEERIRIEKLSKAKLVPKH